MNKKSDIKQLVMPDVCLRPFEIGDIDETYIGWLSNKEIVQHLDVCHIADDRLRLIKSAHARIEDPNCWFFAITDSAQERIGTISLQKEPWDLVASYGYLIGNRDYWGSNYSIQAQTAILDFGFFDLKLRRIWGATADNLSSLFNFKRLGFVHEGTRRLAMLNASGQAVDTLQFGILAGEWNESRKNLLKRLIMAITDFEVGQVANAKIIVSQEYLEAFADFSGDRNPLHLDPDFAKNTKFRRPIAHGLSYSAIVSRIIGMDLPGPGSLWLSQNFEFHLPVFVNDEVSISATVMRISQSAETLDLSIVAVNQRGDKVMSGSAKVQLLSLDTSSEMPVLPDDQRVALVVGGVRGIGASVVERLAEDGFCVGATYRKSETEASSLAESYESVYPINADVSDTKSAPKVMDNIKRKFGKFPDTVVFCASPPISYAKTAENEYDTFTDYLSVSLGGTHAIVRSVIPEMIKNNFGRIIGISSTYSLANPPEKMAPYIVSKSALNSYIRCLAVDYGPDGIRANIVAPSMTASALLASVPERQLKVAGAKNPSRRLGRPGDVSSAVSFLASADADYINGETLIISGGSLIQ